MCTSESSCGCATTATAPIAVASPAAGGGSQATYTVAGMTCGSCARRVTQHVSAVAGVTAVAVDVATGQVTVTSTTNPPAADIRAAVEQAGYRLTD